MKEIVALVFGFGMFLNAGLFIPQAWHLLRTRNSQGISVPSFVGFNLLQLTGALHGFFQHDPALAFGMLASLVTCGSVTVLALRYRSPAVAQVQASSAGSPQ